MILKKEESTNERNTTASNALSRSMYFMLIFLIFNIVDRMKFICIFFGETS